MKKALIVYIALLVLMLAFTASADARCGVGCLNHKVQKLSTSLKKAEQTIAAQGETIAQQIQAIVQQSQALATAKTEQTQTAKQVKSLFACLVEAPLTQYGEPEGPLGYLFQYENEAEEIKTIPTTALDVTYSGDQVGGWALFDACNTAETASTASRGALAPAGDLRSLLQPQARFP